MAVEGRRHGICKQIKLELFVFERVRFISTREVRVLRMVQGDNRTILHRLFLAPLSCFFCWSRSWRPALNPVESFQVVAQIETKRKGGMTR